MGQSETMIGANWTNSTGESRGTKALDREARLYEGTERRDTYRLSMTNGNSVKMIMIFNDMIIKKGVITNLSAGGFSCDFMEPTILPLGQKAQIRFKLVMDDPVIIKSEAIFLGTGKDSRINRFEFSDIMSEGERDSIHQYILIKQLELFRNNRRKIMEE